MNKRFAKHVAKDVLMWTLMVFAFQGYALAENALLFFLWALVAITVLGLIAWPAQDDHAKRTAIAKNETQQRTHLHRYYSMWSSMAEAVVLAAFGWFWTAAAWLVASILASGIANDIDTIIREREESQ